MATIRFYLKGPEEYRFLSNFFPSPFTLDGVRYESNEHYFQSQKALDPEEAGWVRSAPTALEAKRRGRKIGICGQAPSDFPDFATFLVEQGIDSISLVSDTVVKTRLAIAAKERELGITP